MNKTKYLILNIVLFVSLMGFTSFVNAQTPVTERNPRLVVSFFSICCGIDQKAQEQLDAFIKRYEKTRRKKLTRSEVRWGREGEIDYCFQLSEISRKEQKKLISQVRLLLKKSKLVRIEENVACQSVR